MKKSELVDFLPKHTAFEDVCLKHVETMKIIADLALPYNANETITANAHSAIAVTNDGSIFSESDNSTIRIYSPLESKSAEYEKKIENKTLGPDQENPLYKYCLFNPNESISFSVHPRFLIWPKHRHDYIEMLYVYSGQCRQIINDTPVIMQEGEMCILDTNVVHQIEQAGENDIIIQCLIKQNYFDSSFSIRLSGSDLLSSFLANAFNQNENLNQYFLFHCSDNDNIRQTMENVLREYYDKHLCSDEIINSYLNILFIELIRNHTSDIYSQNYGFSNHSKISEIIIYILNNYKDVTLSSVACHFNFSPIYLSRMIKKTTGHSFIDILQESRLKRARVLLKTTRMPIIEISNEVGYANINFFYQIFMKYYGCTPMEFRNVNGVSTVTNFYVG